jgi:Cu(I)/Ag(I) efflux system membrane protein CusA/SilA
MIERLVDVCARHRLLTLTLAAAAAAIGWQSMARLPLDALPDTSDRQVIVRSEWDRSPDLIDAQVTRPIVSALLGAPHVKSVRGISDFGMSVVYVLLEDNADLDAARSRTVESLSRMTPKLPDGVKTEIGPDATPLGWVFQYALVDESHSHSLSDLRAYQDWYLKYYLAAVPGVAEVATVGGFVRQFQINVDPNRLRMYSLSIQRVVGAVRNGNRDAGGRVVETGGAEFIVRGLGSAKSTGDLEQILVSSAADGTPVRIRDVATVTIGSEFRRGAVDFDGMGDTVSGIVVMRQGQNALDVINRVKARLAQVEGSIPPGMRVIPVYDRSALIERSISSLRWTILEVMATVTAVVVIFLWHVPSAAVPLVTLPFSVLIAFIPLRLLGVSANIMSLGGVAIAIGTLVDAAIVVVEQTHKALDAWGRSGQREPPATVILRAIKLVARPSFLALLVIAVSFLPIILLPGEQGRLFGPLAYAKSLAVITGAILAITLDPALRMILMRVTPFRFRPSWVCRLANAVLVSPIRPEDQHPISRGIMRLYEPVVNWSLDHRRGVFGAAVVLLLTCVPVWLHLNSEVMPAIDEGALLYMPSTLPGIPLGEAQRVLQITDRALKAFPEVDHVLGKVGHADTATDPAPVSMFETIIVLRPSSEWPRVATWYSEWAPEWLRPVLGHITPDHISQAELVSEMNEALKLPGLANAWAMPIRGRLDMLASGVRTAIGLKITGNSIDEIERVASATAGVLQSVPGTRGAFAERLGQGNFLDLEWNREALARAGLTIDDAQSSVQYGVGGEHVTDIIEGRERYPVQVRFLADFRSEPDTLGRVFVSTEDGRHQVPLADLVKIQATSGPAMLRNDDGLLTGYVYLDVTEQDYGSYMQVANRLIRERVHLPPGYSISWTGEYEAGARARLQLMQIVPLTLLIIVLLIYTSTRSFPQTLLVLLAVPFSAVGAIWTLYWLGYNTSLAVWVGLIALMGVDAETGIFMLLYLDEALDRARREQRLESLAGLRDAIIEGSARRVRPKFMTVLAMFVGLAPVLWSTGTGSEVMKRIAAPMAGGILTSFALELIVYPAIYYSWKARSGAFRLSARQPQAQQTPL